MRRILICVLFFLVACTNLDKEKVIIPLSETEKKSIEEFAKRLTESINNYEYDLVRNSWNQQAFKNRVTHLSKAEQSAFDYFYEKELSKDILNVNIDLVNKLKYNNGRLYLSKVLFKPNYAEITFSLIFNENVDFWKYRIELLDSIPMLTDYYSFKDDFWQSENMNNIMSLNSKYISGSKERQLTNKCILESEKYMRQGNLNRALEELYMIPETHLIGNIISLKRINLAYQINDSTFFSVLEKEKASNKSIYIEYLYYYYNYDSIRLNEIFDKLETDLGKNNQIMDSLKTLEYFWN